VVLNDITTNIDSIGLNVYKYPIATLAGEALLGPLSLGLYGKDKKIYIEGKREKVTLYIYIYIYKGVIIRKGL
jgi:hypothetical protein